MDLITPDQSAELMTEIEPVYGPRQPLDLDTIGAAYLAESKRTAAREYWRSVCPDDMRETDFMRANLLPYSAQTAAILGHSPTSKGLCASGPTGRGKTRAMWQLMHRLACDEGREIRCFPAVEFFATLAAQVNYGRDDASGWVNTVARRGIVFLDDLGQEAMTKAKADWAQAWFLRFLDIRVGEKLPLYLTTNLTAAQIAEPNTPKGSLRADPLLRRLLDLCELVKF